MSMKKSAFILMLCFLTPMAAFADTDKSWSGMPVATADDCGEIDFITEAEITQLISLSKSGDTNAQYALGVAYKQKHEHEKAASWFKRAAEQGHVPARYSYNENAAAHAEVASINW